MSRFGQLQHNARIMSPVTTSKNTISLVIADTDSYRLARNAVERTIGLFPVNEVLIFSDDPLHWPGFQVIPVPKIASITDYNRIILFELPKHLKTDFALVIQFDGFVINPDEFSDFFYKFDYIGAIWPNTKLGHMVGNGGFSLRSKRLVQSVAKLSKSVDVTIPEDRTVSRLLRPALEEFGGIVYAPPEVACYFSIEFDRPGPVLPFGFHGMHLLPIAYQNDCQFLIEHLSERCLREGSYQLNQLRRGFAGLSTEAQELFAKRLAQRN